MHLADPTIVFLVDKTALLGRKKNINESSSQNGSSAIFSTDITPEGGQCSETACSTQVQENDFAWEHSMNTTEDYSGDYISWLRSFYQLAELRSFSRAADAVGRAQSTITYQLKKLEQRLGVELVNRRAMPLELTPAGEQLYLLCQQLFRLLQQVSDQVGSGEQIRGNIVIAANYGIATYYLPPRLQAFKLRCPMVTVEVRPQPIGELMKSYHAPDVDMLLTQQNVIPDGAQSFPLFSAEMALVTPASWDVPISDPPRLEDFVHLPFVAFWSDYPIDGHVARVIAEAGYTLNIEQYGSFFLPILMHVSVGRGISIMDEFQARTPGFNVNVHSLAKLFDKREYVVSHRPRQYHSPAVREFIRFLQEEGRQITEQKDTADPTAR